MTSLLYSNEKIAGTLVEEVGVYIFFHTLRATFHNKMSYKAFNTCWTAFWAAIWIVRI